ncbi:MAG: thioredoxin fold domain-containing protein [Muribaculaceae bacterium]|nr:thioredoxin fold domain-containing protein [Muribaculaceae bacterium]
MMKKIFFCLMAVLMLAACETKTTKQDNNEATGNENTKSEMPEVTADDEGQTEWIKQTTIMTSKPMVIDFFATWCGPCKELSPILDEIEKKHKGDVIFRRIDVDKEPELAQEFNIQGVPTLMFVTPKGEYQTMLGVQSPEDIEAKISALVKRSGQ